MTTRVNLFPQGEEIWLSSAAASNERNKPTSIAALTATLRNVPAHKLTGCGAADSMFADHFYGKWSAREDDSRPDCGRAT